MKWILTLALLLSITATANSDLKKAEAYYYGTNEVFKDYTEAKKYFLKAAEDGSPEAHRYLASMYLYGEGLPVDKYTAKMWLEKAISLGDNKAKGLYTKYFGSPSIIPNTITTPKPNITEETSKYKDYKPSSDTVHNAKLNFIKGKEQYQQKNYIQAKEYYKKACDEGLTEVCNSLAFIYIESKLSKDYTAMVEVLKQGCDKDNAVSCLLLASTYKGVYTKQSNKGKVVETKKKGCDLLEKVTLASEIKEKKKAWSCGKSAAEKQKALQAEKERKAKAAREAKIKAEKNKKYSLTVKPTPSDARVQITNIKPKYKDRIQLKKGKYTIKVSKKGYEDKRYTFDLTKSITVSVELKKMETKITKIKSVITLGKYMWQNQNSNKTKLMPWKQAMSYCQNLTLGGYSDWRLPSLEVLRGLLKDKEKFDNHPKITYWTSTSGLGGLGYRVVALHDGYGSSWRNAMQTSSSSHVNRPVRCVRTKYK